ncbi:MAG: hypothetical protein Q8L41_10875 [Anaerolineales bacterium]|nr:hypothetical protein [Anaerolineales bacterium]
MRIQCPLLSDLGEIVPVTKRSGRLGENEFTKAKKYKNDYGLVVVSNLEALPKLTSIFNPVVSFALKKQITTNKQTSYHSTYMTWLFIGGDMHIQADFKHVVGEVKERNQLYKALNEIREIALITNSKDMPDDVREQFVLIVQECNDALKPISYKQIFKALTKRMNLK